MMILKSNIQDAR